MNHTDLIDWLEQHGYTVSEPRKSTSTSYQCAAHNPVLCLRVNWDVCHNEVKQASIAARTSRGGYAARKWTYYLDKAFLDQEATVPGYTDKINKVTLHNLPEPCKFVTDLCEVLHTNLYWKNDILPNPAVTLGNMIGTCSVIYIAHLSKNAKVVEHRGENGVEPWYFMLCLTSTQRRFTIITDSEVYYPVHYTTLKVGRFDTIPESTRLNHIDQQMICQAIQCFLHGPGRS